MPHPIAALAALTVLLLATSAGSTTLGAVEPLPLVSVGKQARSHHLVAWAPGYPGDTAQAQETMDGFAALLASAAGWEARRVSAEYHETEQGGLERLATDATLALLPLALYIKHGEELQLEPLAQTVQPSGSAKESWSLVAARARVTGPEALDGWEISGIPSYAPAFVAGTLLGAWGQLPQSARFVTSSRVLAAIRRARANENVAVLLDGAQTDALSRLPYADELEIVARSPAVISGLLVSVGEISSTDSTPLFEGLMHIHERPESAAVLRTLRLKRFEQVDTDSLAASIVAYRAALGSALGERTGATNPTDAGSPIR